MDRTFCCSKCFEQIAKKSTCAARLWLEICDVIYQGELLRVFSSGETLFDEHLKILEELGYVLSTDLEEVLAIKLINFDPLNPKYPFCTDKSHEEDMQQM